jgi:membrane protein YqaA with SNARE-associated domain
MEGKNTSWDALDSGEEDADLAIERHENLIKRVFLSRRLLIRVLTILVVIAITVTIFVFRDKIAGFESLGYLGAFLIALVTGATIVLPVPGIVLIFGLAAVPEYNPLLIGLAAGAGSALGEITGYMAGFGGQLVFENSSTYLRLKEWMIRRGAIVIFVLSFVPNPFFDIAGAVAGVLRYPLWKFLLSCFLGKTLRYILVAYFGWFVGVSWF